MLTRVRLLWPRGHVPTGQNLRDLDENTFRSIDGHGGGSYTPSDPLTIGGAGVQIISKSLVELSGAVVPAAGKRITFGKGTTDDAFRYGAGHTSSSRSLLRVIDEGWSAQGSGALGFDTATATIQTQIPGARFFLPMRVFDGGTLASVDFRWRVTGARTLIPANLPKFRVVRISRTGTIEPLRAEDATTDPDGWLVWNPRPTSGANYANAGAVKTLTYTCNQKNVIDRSLYVYLGQIEDESGTNAFTGVAGSGNVFHSTLCHHTGIPRLALRQ